MSTVQSSSGREQRFIAEWVVKAAVDERGDSDAWNDETETSEHTTLTAAKRAACRNSRRAGARTDYAVVTVEEKFGIADWRDGGRWVGCDGRWERVA